MPEYQTLSILEDGTGKQVGVILVIDNAIAAIISSYPRHDFGYDGVVGIGDRLLAPFRAAEAAFLRDAEVTAYNQGWLSDVSIPVSVTEELRSLANTAFVDLARNLGDEAVRQVAMNQLANATGSSIISTIASEIGSSGFGQIFVRATLNSGVDTFKTLLGLDVVPDPQPSYLQDVHFVDEPEDLGPFESRLDDGILLQFGRGCFGRSSTMSSGPSGIRSFGFRISLPYTETTIMN